MIKNVIVTIHGIQTKFNKSPWQDEMKTHLYARSGEIRVENFKYPFVSNFLGILPWISTFPTQKLLAKTLRNYYAGRLKKFLKKVKKKHPVAKIHIVAHSFGTWIVHEVLKDLPLKVGTVHIIAGVLSAYIEHNTLDEELKKGEIEKIYIYSSKNDQITMLAPPPFGPPGFANCGFWGILRKRITITTIKQIFRPVYKPYPDLEIYNEVTDYEHSGYFTQGTYNKILAYVLAKK